MNDDAFGYPQRGNAAFEEALAKRTPSADAAFLLPHLRADMRLLDLGCGPGSITVGLAEVLAGGHVSGIDLQPSQIDKARALAAQRGVTNVELAVADIYCLPFADASFDVAFANGVLMHLSEPVRALSEVRRVLRPNGIVAVRDPDAGTSAWTPTTPLREEWRAIAVRVRQHNGGDPFVGREHRRLLLEAGFARSRATASVSCAGSVDETRQHCAFLKAQLIGLSRTALAQGWMEAATVDAVAAEIDAWSERPDAFSAIVWCEAVGWVD